MEWFYQEFAKAVAQSRDTTEKLGAPQKLAIIARGKNYDFIPREIQLYIEQTYLWEFRVAARHIKLYISVARGEVAPAHEATKVAEWLNIAATAAPAECSAEMDIYIYLTDLKKELPTRADGGAVREKHANTAFTTSCRKNTEIHLFRREEWLKVFIHETFHAMGLDFSADGVGAHAAARRIGRIMCCRACISAKNRGICSRTRKIRGISNV
jgi:hypothetical protein